MDYRAPYGTEDVLPSDVLLWKKIEETSHKIFSVYGYQEIRTPILEYTKLFRRAVGNTTDIVEKEMYTFGITKEEEELCLRPELTASVVRAFVEHNLFREKSFQKFYYIGPAFRRERPQKGRFREFHTLGVEAIGSSDPFVDAEIIILYHHLLNELCIRDFELNINSIGCRTCRKYFRDALVSAVRENLTKYCETCLRRYTKNPLRILDCKNKSCIDLINHLPHVTDYICSDCKSHFEIVLSSLRQEGIKYKLSPTLVRGLDYYTRTVFEFTSPLLGEVAQNAIASGGRYDNLTAEIGGPNVGAVGWGAGIERIILVMKYNENKNIPPKNYIDFFVVSTGKGCRIQSFSLLNRLRKNGFKGDMDYEDKSVKAQMREANKCGARVVIIIGDEEVSKNLVKVKDMSKGTEKDIGYDNVVCYLKETLR